MSKLKSIREIEMERATQSNFGKGITVASGFDLGAKAPLDSRLTVKTIEERNAHVTGNRAYEGMLVYVEATKKTYQLVDNSWEEFGFNEGKFQDGIQSIVDKNTEQDSRLTAIEELVNGEEGIESIIADVAANTAAIAKEVQDRTQAVNAVDAKVTAEVSRATAAEEALGERIDGVEADLAEAITNAQADATAKSTQALKDAKAYTDAEITKIDTAYKAADTVINGRLVALEGATADLEEIRQDIETNATAIAQEVSDRAEAIESVTSLIEDEVLRATNAETQLGSRIDGVKSDVNKAIETCKTYTDGKVSEINANAEALEERVTANEDALALVDGKIATAKSEAINTSNAHTTSEIAKIDAAYKAADVQTLESAKSYADTKIGEAKTALESSISAVGAKVDSAKVELQGNIDTLAGRVSTNETEISNLKDAVSNKNSNTIVVETEDEIATENPNPKVGDLAYVISSKRAYIFKGVNALSVKSVPQGWVVFDEITSELDLVNYLKKDEAEATYRKLSVKIAESDLATDLSTKINNKADKTYVDTQLEGKTTEAYVNSKVEEVVSPVRAESAQNKADIAKEIQDRTAEITRVDGLIDALEAAIETANRLSAELQAKLEKLEDIEENRILFEEDVM